MNFRFQLRDIVDKYLQTIFNYACDRKKAPYSDLNSNVFPFVEENSAKKLVISLIFFSDNVNIKKSTMKKELWPVWIQIADLPPRLRMSQKNIVLAALSVGGTYPEWNTVVQLLKGELLSSVEVIDKISHSVYMVEFKVRLLVCDLGAKSHLLNMFKFNG